MSTASGVVCMPPLILHPFAEANDPGKLMESSRAGMALEGLLPEDGKSRVQLDRALIEGRYCELRMLFYVGRDLTRWVEQCLEGAKRKPEDYPEGACRQTFVEYLIQHAPQSVEEKLNKWGVHGYQRIFARALALNCVFAEAPPPSALTESFVRHYHRYADQIFSYEQKKPFPSLDASRYTFELFASGEYSRMLERQWEG
ncbi:MAG TPA: hypothetical protein VLT57_12995 [Bryobacteraceae bacterium]|nr:hypothetical protein [Bryobacteraceae bacterium]